MLTPFAFLARWGAALLLVAAPLLAPAQLINTVRFDPPAGAGRLAAQLLPTRGGWLAPGTVQGNYDSSSISLVRLDPGLTITRARQYGWRYRTTFYTSSVATPRGLISSGYSLTSPRWHYVVSFDTIFNQRWGVRIAAQWQSNLVALTMDGGDVVTAYTTTTSILGGGYRFDRFWGSAVTGTGWRGRQLATLTSNFRVNGTLAHGPAGTHYLTGRGNPSAYGVLVKLDTTKVYWARRVSAGGSNEETLLPTAARNGSVWVVQKTQPVAGGPIEQILCRFDTAGNLLTSRRLAVSNRHLEIFSVTELPTGELLLGGSLTVLGATGNRNPILIKLAANGTVEWMRRWILYMINENGWAEVVERPGGGYVLAINGFRQNLAIMDLDANLTSCRLDDEPAGTLVITPTAVTVTPFVLTMTPYVPTVVPETLPPRVIPLTRSLVCSVVGTNEDASAEDASLTVWPQPLPRGAALHLALPAGWNAAETRLTLLSALGQTMWRGTAAEAATTLPALPPGVWTLRATNPRGATLYRRLLTE